MSRTRGISLVKKGSLTGRRWSRGSSTTTTMRELGAEARTRKLRRVLTVNAPPHTVYQVVRDVDQYHEFLPWCDKVVHLERQKKRDTEENDNGPHRFSIHYKFDEIHGLDLSRLFGATEVIDYELISRYPEYIRSSAKVCTYTRAPVYFSKLILNVAEA
mmetsp:Transcript_21367/g.29930  ORF Transcript_21367/g.29930 Transcript_21367/m.29930 type:complete len:159 (-) Transcript_21367:170-646(-)